MHVLIAPNAFKHALSADDASLAIQEGLNMSALECTTELFPIGDGGDGTAILINNKLKGVSIQNKVKDPLGREITALFYFVKQRNSAIIELAEASGIKLLKKEEYNPLRTTTFGTGQLISSALDLGVQKIILCIGGSATVDGGAGLLRALGVRFLERDKKELQNLPEELEKLYSVDISNLDKRIDHCKIIILCDVDNHLLGPQGAASVFGPQKGATNEMVLQLEKCLSQFARITNDQFRVDITNIKHGGAAGGTAAGAHAFLNAQLEDGIESFLSIVNFEKELQKADLVITGEGSIDIQTLHGKGPAGVAKKAKEIGIPVIALAGRIEDEEHQYKRLFDQAICISEKESDLNSALLNTAKNLTKASKLLGDLLAQR